MRGAEKGKCVSRKSCELHREINMCVFCQSRGFFGGKKSTACLSSTVLHRQGPHSPLVPNDPPVIRTVTVCPYRYFFNIHSLNMVKKNPLVVQNIFVYLF